MNEIYCLSITADNSRNTYRQYIIINGTLFYLLLFLDGSEVLPDDTEAINEAKIASGLAFMPAQLLGYDCVISKSF